MEFRFKIGDIVVLKIGIATANMGCRAGDMEGPRHLFIRERRTQECPGGVQLHYLVSNGENSILVLENEVSSPEEFDLDAALDACVEARERIREWKPKRDGETK